MALFGGPGVIYRQFSITIIRDDPVVLVALILTPALCSNPAHAGEKGHTAGNSALSASSSAGSQNI